MERGSFFGLLFIVLAFSRLSTSTTAVSFSRAQRFLQQSRSLEGLGDSLHKVPQMSNHEVNNINGDDLINWRMDMELNDYPKSGSNPHHTPPQPPERD
ncbi:hypothetical protein MA16_Dca002021 [Dendrobium catenatum]|uniref:Uncharacterized protein n=1 Tax=Dendrobium catenatum TaxID=906689 RepID=A0A2I0XE70_9ASPA|nr:hypothetical protein MA16_Dca002021 [Dendrobium catenatum]